VRVSETTCPFCKSTIASVATLPGASNRLTRAAAFAFTTTLAASAASIAACGGSEETKTFAPPYGAAPVPPPHPDAGGDADADAGNQALYGAPAYGAQPVDSGNG
jgi:hypothetical protein